MKIPFGRIIKGLGGISTPYYGVQWNPPKEERDVAAKLMAYLEDQRALYNPYEPGMQDYMDGLVSKMRMHLTDMIDSKMAPPEVSGHIRAMRASCAKFLKRERQPEALLTGSGNEEFFAALGELRAVFGIHIAQLSIKYGLDLHEEFMRILPLPDSDTNQ